MKFENLPLHDAVMAAAHISWDAARCDLRVYPVGKKAHWLVFEGFTKIEFPRNEPWGPSNSINSVKQPKPTKFEIEIQSGDLLRITAEKWSYREE
ncbi:MAG TPA: hypothetical protein VIM85_02510 [Pseudomonadales bacterium]